MTHKKLYYFLIALLVFILLLGCFIAFCPKGKSDALKFKEEYEQYNDKYLELNIDKDNPFVYRNEKEISKILKKNTGLVYFGNPKDENSRIALQTVLELAKTNDVKKIYYINVNDITYKKLKKYLMNDISIVFVIAGEEIASYKNDDFKTMSISGNNIKKEINYYMQQTFNDYCDETCND